MDLLRRHFTQLYRISVCLGSMLSFFNWLIRFDRCLNHFKSLADPYVVTIKKIRSWLFVFFFFWNFERKYSSSSGMYSSIVGIMSESAFKVKTNFKSYLPTEVCTHFDFLFLLHCPTHCMPSSSFMLISSLRFSICRNSQRMSCCRRVSSLNYWQVN